MATLWAVPAQVVAGDTITWSIALADYPASDGWVLSYALRNAAGMYDFTAAAAGADHAVTVTAAVSKGWAPGVYAWAAFVTKGAERRQVASGSIVVQPNLAQAAPIDARDHVQRVLDAIEAVIEKRATRDQEEFTIGDRSLKRTPIAELIKLRQLYRSEKKRADDAAAIAAGRPSKSRLLVRFSPVN